jgi:hypothetical protein
MKKVLKFLGIFIALLVVVVVILGLIAPKEFNVERSVTINTPQPVVADHMFHFGNFHNWSPFHQMDPGISDLVIGDDGKEGAMYQWKGEKAGEGEMKAKFVTANELQYDMHFKEPMEQDADGYWRAEDMGNGQTKAIWGFKCAYPFPLNGVMMAVGMEKMLGKNFQDGLNNLKKYSEAHIPAAPVTAMADTTAAAATPAAK